MTVNVSAGVSEKDPTRRALKPAPLSKLKLSDPSRFHVRSSADICAKLVTVKNGRREGLSMRSFVSSLCVTHYLQLVAIILMLDKPVTIGRNPERWFACFLHPSDDVQRVV